MDNENKECCGTCRCFNGKVGDGNKFCDELETFVDETWCCNKYDDFDIWACE